MPKCRTCRIVLDQTSFEFRKDTNKYRTQCRQCERSRERELYQIHIHRERTSRRYWAKTYRKRDRLKAMEIIGKGKIECSECHCSIPEFIEINHMNGGGTFEHETLWKNDELVKAILKGTRSVEDLNLLCRPCNGVDHLRRRFGPTGHKIVWSRP